MFRCWKHGTGFEPCRSGVLSRLLRSSTLSPSGLVISSQQRYRRCPRVLSHNQAFPFHSYPILRIVDSDACSIALKGTLRSEDCDYSETQHTACSCRRIPDRWDSLGAIALWPAALPDANSQKRHLQRDAPVCCKQCLLEIPPGKDVRLKAGDQNRHRNQIWLNRQIDRCRRTAFERRSSGE